MARHHPAVDPAPPRAADAAPRAPSVARRIWQSIVLRGPIVPRTDRDRAFVTIHTLLLHLRPVKVPAATLRFTHTFGLGGSSLVLIGILAASGLLLTLGYQPVPVAAHDSILSIENAVTFGPLVRGVHYWSANLLVVVMLLHAARVFFTGGYHGPRQFNWVIGVTLLLVVLANAFTGYLLPWDQLSYWAITISTGMLAYVPVFGAWLQQVARGGSDIGATTLVVFYTLHTSIVPAGLVVLLSFHFWRVRKAGGVVVPPSGAAAVTDSTAAAAADEKVFFIPHLLVRELSLALVITAVVVVLGAFAGAPLGELANPGMSPNPAKAPWYFMGLQELLVHFHPVVAVCLLPLAGLAALLLLPYVTSDTEPHGAWFLSGRGRAASKVAAIVALAATLALVVAHEVIVRVWPGGTNWITGGALPVALLGGGSFVFLRVLRARLALTTNELAQAAVVLGAAAFTMLTLVGIWFRGPGMSLVWPWAR
jgi:quinol-cytochrome oxidoreductase complex cytochrome b subunit